MELPEIHSPEYAARRAASRENWLDKRAMEVYFAALHEVEARWVNLPRSAGKVAAEAYGASLIAAGRISRLDLLAYFRELFRHMDQDCLAEHA